jgi:hypothetical protein
MENEDGEQETLLRSAEWQITTVVPNRDRAENRELHVRGS